ncbi:hypothetical protein J4430_00580 [Candidatus Woesearchaeota archaeon]|nr:hypothetical protein [Candidatus Woesearchaeota archaeon]
MAIKKIQEELKKKTKKEKERFLQEQLNKKENGFLKEKLEELLKRIRKDIHKKKEEKKPEKAIAEQLISALNEEEVKPQQEIEEVQEQPQETHRRDYNANEYGGIRTRYEITQDNLSGIAYTTSQSTESFINDLRDRLIQEGRISLSVTNAEETRGELRNIVDELFHGSSPERRIQYFTKLDTAFREKQEQYTKRKNNLP